MVNIPGNVPRVVRVQLSSAVLQTDVLARSHRRDIRKYLQGRPRRRNAESILVLISETGAIYTLIWVSFPDV